MNGVVGSIVAIYRGASDGEDVVFLSIGIIYSDGVMITEEIYEIFVRESVNGTLYNNKDLD
uniref:Uncharacterized protein n=1 Tax=Moniliophthora roreri TaxID=221103 RepID=A0A0W0FNM8_MONRR